jgi:ankyrin repeat protein
MKKNENCLLHIATAGGYSNIVKYLIANGANVNAKDTFEMTALHLASRNEQLEIVQCLIEKGADVNSKDNSETFSCILWGLKNCSISD